MYGQSVSILQQYVNAASNWRTSAATENVELFQVNANFPDGRAVTLVWNEQAHDNGDGTFTGDWQVITQQ